jgi:DNA-binding Lrp family transcriptional regulator
LRKDVMILSDEILTGKPLKILHMLHDRSKPVTTYSIQLKQSELADDLKITRQALNVHLRKLRDRGYVRTGRGFIDITEKGLGVLGYSSNPTFIFVKVSPQSRRSAYEAMTKLPIQRAYRVAGDMDVLIVVRRERLDEVLREVSSVQGVEDTKSYVTIEVMR